VEEIVPEVRLGEWVLQFDNTLDVKVKEVLK